MSRDVAGVFADIDAFDPDKFVAHLTPDAKFRFANADPVTGRAAVTEAVAGFFSTAPAMALTLPSRDRRLAPRSGAVTSPLWES